MLYLRGVGNFVYGSKKTGACDQMPRALKKRHQGSENRFSRPRRNWVTRVPRSLGNAAGGGSCFDVRRLLLNGYNCSMKNKNRARIGERIGTAYERFLDLPVPVVLAILWLTGIVLIGSIAAMFYLYGALLWRIAGL
jgi:hypothetical protein